MSDSLPALDRTIPFYNLILRADAPVGEEAGLPPGFVFSFYQPGDAAHWARLETEIGDFASIAQAQAYFTDTYLAQPELLPSRCLFVRTAQGETVASCIAWQDERGEALVSSLHWLVVSPRYQRRGIGRALFLRTMRIFEENRAFPVYIHTQPWSHQALTMYARHGFALQREDTFARYENQYAQGMETLRAILSPEAYACLTGEKKE
jgi:ribosomal protein S18 acetylase RimI-like enzyme